MKEYFTIDYWIKKSGLKNKYFFVFILLFAGSWLLHSRLFQPAFSNDTLFFPTFGLGVITGYLMVKVFEERGDPNVN